MVLLGYVSVEWWGVGRCGFVGCDDELVATLGWWHVVDPNRGWDEAEVCAGAEVAHVCPDIG